MGKFNKDLGEKLVVEVYDESGALEADAVAHNSAIVAGGSDPDNMLKQMLHEYVAFALFSGR